jgi:type VII secretion-associated serine protease mycosin
MYRLIRTVVAAVLAWGLVVAAAAPGAAASYPPPRPEQWWFTAWAVENKVWPISQGRGVTVAVIDTGVQADIPDLRGVVVPGTDFHGGDGRTNDPAGIPPGHGTGMASLIASQGTGTGFVGVAPRAKILPIVSEDSDTEPLAIRYAVNHGARVINISEGSPAPCPQDTQEAVGYALRHGVVVVAAAGNEGPYGNPSDTPANCAGVLAMGGVNARLGIFAETERHPYVAAAAPATGVGGVLPDGKYHSSSGGTSSASALTSAVAALIRSKFPDLSAGQVVQRIIASTRDAGPPGHDDMTGYGAVRPYQALTMNVPASAPNPVFAAYDRWLAAHARQAAAAAAQRKRQAADAAANDLGGLLPLAGLAVAVPVLGVVLAVFLRSRRRRGAVKRGAGPGSGGPAGPPSPGGQGPPASSPWQS